MEKLLKKETITFLIAEVFITLAAVFCIFVPLFSETLILTGRNAIIGYVFFGISLLSTIILYYSKQQYRLAIMCRYIHDSFNQWWFDFDNCREAGIVSAEETDKRKEKLNKVINWTFNFYSVTRIFIWFDILANMED